ncbi:MAG: hypothetical protein AABY22_25750, partial [Nanoarchaeota archaeon]
MLYWLIETQDQLKEFYSRDYKEVFIEPILFNDQIHPKLNQLCALYIKPFNNDKGYMLCISHDDTLSLNIQHIDTILQDFDAIYVRDQKLLSYWFSSNSFIDISFSLNDYKAPNTQTHSFFYQKYGSKYDINKLIPIVKHYEKCELIWEQIKDKFDRAKNPYYNTLSVLFSLIEKNGIKIDTELFNEHYDLLDKAFNIQDNTIYTNYNLHTTTGRPANSFNGINFAALKKSSGERKCFIPENDCFIEYDIDAYHPNLAAKLIGYDFNGENPYQYFSREAGIELSEAKTLMFKQLYGGIFKEYKNLEFFKKIQLFTDKIWEEFNNGKYTCPGSNHVFYKDKLKDMNPPKLFNYLLQNQETYNNVIMLKEILRELWGKETKLVLYTFDAFLFDFNKSENETI